MVTSLHATRKVGASAAGVVARRYCLAGSLPPARLCTMTSAQSFLRAYDHELRTDAETPSADDVTLLGPLRLVTFARGRGFVTYQDLAGSDSATITGWVWSVVEHYRQQPEVTRLEWKTRGHDDAPGLVEALLDHGFVAEETESIMIGDARLLAADVPISDEIRLRRVIHEGDVRAMSAMQDAAFGDPVHSDNADALLDRLALRDGMELWVAEVGASIVGAGRLEPVADSQFAGIWGGAVLKPWRGRGIYRALTAARARSALALGKTLIHSDSTEYSRPILERSGLVKVSTTTPYRLIMARELSSDGSG